MPTDKDTAWRGCAEVMLRHLYKDRQVTNPSCLLLLPTRRDAAATPSYSLLPCCSRNTNTTRPRLDSVEVSGVLGRASEMHQGTWRNSVVHAKHFILLCFLWDMDYRSYLTQNCLWEYYFGIVCSRGIRRGGVGPQALRGKFVSCCTVARKAGDSPGTGLL